MEVRAVTLTTGVAAAVAVTFIGICSCWYWQQKNKSKRVLPQKYRKVATVTKVIIYPIKALPGIEVDNAICEPAGLRSREVYDRTWMIASKKNVAVYLKTEPRLALLSLSLHGDQVWVDGPDMPTLKLDIIHSSDISRNKAEIYAVGFDKGKAIDCKEDATKWFQKYLGRNDIKLVQHLLQFPEKCIRSKEATETPRTMGEPLVLQFYSSYHLLSQASLDFLNKQLENPASYRQFRPNIVIDGCKSHEEDGWEYVKFNDSTVLYFVQSTIRCNVTTVNPDTGTKLGVEPLATLRKYRLGNNPDTRSRFKSFPFFGVNLGLAVGGTVSVGDTVSVGINV